MFNCGLSMYILSSSIQGYINEAVGKETCTYGMGHQAL